MRRLRVGPVLGDRVFPLAAGQQIRPAGIRGFQGLDKPAVLRRARAGSIPPLQREVGGVEIGGDEGAPDRGRARAPSPPARGSARPDRRPRRRASIRFRSKYAASSIAVRRLGSLQTPGRADRSPGSKRRASVRSADLPAKSRKRRFSAKPAVKASAADWPAASRQRRGRRLAPRRGTMGGNGSEGGNGAWLRWPRARRVPPGGLPRGYAASIADRGADPPRLADRRARFLAACGWSAWWSSRCAGSRCWRSPCSLISTPARPSSSPR